MNMKAKLIQACKNNGIPFFSAYGYMGIMNKDYFLTITFRFDDEGNITKIITY